MTTWFSAAWVETLLASLPIFSRVLGLLVGSPFYGQRSVPVQAKVGLALFLTVLFAPLAPVPLPLSMLQRAFVCAAELILGLAMGYVVRLVFSIVQVSGQIMEAPMGFGMAELLDPSGTERVPLVGQFYYLLVAQVFFAVDGHLMVLRALGDSLTIVPAGKAAWGELVAETVFRTFAEVFVAGVKIAAPVVVAVFVTDAGLAIANRAVQQLDIFSVGFSLKTAAGITAVLVALPALVQGAMQVFSSSGLLLEELYSLVRGLAPR